MKKSLVFSWGVALAAAGLAGDDLRIVDLQSRIDAVASRGGGIVRNMK